MSPLQFAFSHFGEARGGTAHDENNLTGLNARAARITPRSPPAGAAIHVQQVHSFVHTQGNEAHRMFCFRILFLALWCLVAVGSRCCLVGALHSNLQKRAIVGIVFFGPVLARCQ